MSNLTEKQQLFLKYLFELKKEDYPTESKRLRAAANLAGYSEDTAISLIIKGMSKEVVDKAYEYAATHLPKALIELIGVLDDPTKPGAKTIIKTAETLMDRGGLAKTDKVSIEIDTPNNILILPPKGSINKE